MTEGPADTEASASLPLLDLTDGLPPVLGDPDEIIALCRQLEAVPAHRLAIDTERASGHRYGGQAYLVQVKTDSLGTTLIDPTGVLGDPAIAALAEVFHRAEWVLHSASQDLPCLADLGLRPGDLFDTEIAARLLGKPRVGLASLMETEFGVRLEKRYSAVDWSTRPLPREWLVYAALDVERLLPLADRLTEQLHEAQRWEWARQEFDYVRLSPPRMVPADPWRKAAGIHRLKTREQLYELQVMWETRDQIAQDDDIAPRRLVPDALLVSVILAQPTRSSQMYQLLSDARPRHRKAARRVWDESAARRRTPPGEYPPLSVPNDGPPPVKFWSEKNPAAAAALGQARTAIAERAETLGITHDTLMTPDSVRRFCWEHPAERSPARIAEILQELGARPWQVAEVADLLAAME